MKIDFRLRMFRYKDYYGSLSTFAKLEKSFKLTNKEENRWVRYNIKVKDEVPNNY